MIPHLEFHSLPFRLVFHLSNRLKVVRTSLLLHFQIHFSIKAVKDYDLVKQEFPLQMYDTRHCSKKKIFFSFR